MSCASKDHLGYGKLSSFRFRESVIHQVYRKIVYSSRILKPCSTFFTPQVGIPQDFWKTVLMCVHITGYGFLKWPERTEISRILMGRGLLWADGEHAPLP